MRTRIMTLIQQTAATDKSVVFLTGDLGFSVVENLAECLGERFINVGVAEANMVGMAASLAASGFKPFTYTIAPFMSARCYEQIRNDVAYQKRTVRLIAVGAGFSYGTLGPSHHALEDATILAALPDMIIGNPGNADELDRFYELAMQDPRPAYFRIARDSGRSYPVAAFTLDDAAFTVRPGLDVTLVASGMMVSECLIAADQLAADGIAAKVVSVPVLAPFPRAALAREIALGPVISVFEGYPGNPLSTGVMATLLGLSRPNRFSDLSARHQFAREIGGTDALRRHAGIDSAAIAATARVTIAAS
jgi:transketolase